MPYIVYVLQFTGEALQIGIDGNVLKTSTGASSGAFETWIGIDGLLGRLRTMPGEDAGSESEIVFTGETTFQQTGTIAFGVGGHSVRFSSVGSGHLGPLQESNHRRGAAIWRIDAGEGQFAGATGLIVSNFLVSDTGEMTDHQLGVVFVRD